MAEEKINYTQMLAELRASQQADAANDRATLKPVYEELSGNSSLRGELINQSRTYSVPGGIYEGTPSEKRIQSLRSGAAGSRPENDEYRMFVAVAIEGGMSQEATGKALNDYLENSDVTRLAGVIGDVAMERAAAQAREQGVNQANLKAQEATIDACKDIPNTPSKYQEKIDCYTGR